MSKHVDTTENSADKSTAPLAFDADDYKTCLNDTDLSDAQKVELLQNLWHIMSAFVDMGWGVDNISLFFPELFNKAAAEEFALDSSLLLDSEDSTKELAKNNATKEGEE